MNVKKIGAALRLATTCSNNIGFSTSMPISGDHPRFVKNHGDALTNVLRMYHGLSRFPKSWTSGTKDRDSVTEANEDVVRKKQK